MFSKITQYLQKNSSGLSSFFQNNFKNKFHLQKFWEKVARFNFVIISGTVSKWWHHKLSSCYETKYTVTVNKLLMWHWMKYYNLRHFHDDEIKIQFRHLYDKMNFMIKFSMCASFYGLTYGRTCGIFSFRWKFWNILTFFLLGFRTCDNLWF